MPSVIMYHCIVFTVIYDNCFFFVCFLFRSYQRMFRAAKELIRTPQNNLRIFKVCFFITCIGYCIGICTWWGSQMPFLLPPSPEIFPKFFV